MMAQMTILDALQIALTLTQNGPVPQALQHRLQFVLHIVGMDLKLETKYAMMPIQLTIKDVHLIV